MMNNNEPQVSLSPLELKVLRNHFKHFDIKPNAVQAAQFLNSIVNDPDVVAHHRFMPFITFNMEKRIYQGWNHDAKPKLKIKQRPIALASYHDALIYAHYAEQLDHNYERYIASTKIDSVPTAYRKQLHISNIHAAKEVFDHVTKTDHCLIIKGDFKGFFDNLRHRILRENLCKTLGTQQLSSDWQAVIKSLTRYRSVHQDELIDALQTAHMYNENHRSYIIQRKELGTLIKSDQLKLDGPNQVGIPQGTALSAILANVYMIDFDKTVNELVINLNGLYRRYSDDFIIAIPLNDRTQIEYHALVDHVIKLSQDQVHLQIEKNKTKVFEYHDQEITELNRGNKTNLDYLGFVFDGKVVRLRNKSIYKFHYKSKRSIKRLFRIQKDYENVQNNRVPSVNEVRRMVWQNNERIHITVNQKSKQQRFKNRIENVRNKINLNLTQHKITTKMYLSDKRYGEKYSMIGYAKRAQHIFSDNNGQYKVNIVQPIKNQLYKNRKYLSWLKSIEAKR